MKCGSAYHPGDVCPGIFDGGQSGRANKGAQVQEHEVAQLLPLTVPEVRRLRLRGWCGKLPRRPKECFIGHTGAGDIKPEPNNPLSNGVPLAWLPKCGCSTSDSIET